MTSTDAVVVASATDTHLEIALKAAMAGKPIYLEKPISHNLEGVENFKEIVQKQKLVVEVGCQLRTHPNLKYLAKEIKRERFGPLYTFRATVGQRLDEWRPGTNYRECYSADVSKGGGALFDLIHEIDLINWFAGPIHEVYAHLAHVSDLEIVGEDLANLVLVTKSGAVGHIQLDMLSPTYRRGLELVFRDALFTWNYVNGSLSVETKRGRKIVNKVTEPFDRNTLFIAHMRRFLARVTNQNGTPVCSLDDGISALKVAQASRLSSECGHSFFIGDLDI